MECPNTAESVNFDVTSAAFVTWLVQSGASVSDKISLVDLRSSRAGRGVVATRDIAQDELLFRIPRALPLSVANSRLKSALGDFLTQQDSLDPWLALILAIVYEFIHLHSSPWKPYLDILPASFDTLMFWTDSQLAQLQASPVVGKIGKAEAEETFREVLMPIVQANPTVFIDPHSGAMISESDLVALSHRAGSLIMAYAFDLEPVLTSKSDSEPDEEGYVLEPDDQDLPKAMIPLADMLNADGNRNNARLFHTAEYLEMRTIKPVPAGEQLFNDYGPLPSSDLLRRYGYVTPRYARYDIVEFPTELLIQLTKAFTNSAADIDKRINILEKAEIVDSGYDIGHPSFMIPSDSIGNMSSPNSIFGGVSDEFAEFIALLLIPKDDFTRCVRKGKSPKVKPYENQILQILCAAAKNMLGRYETSAAHDTALIESVSNDKPGSISGREELAVRVRLGEKRVLHHWIGSLENLPARFP